MNIKIKYTQFSLIALVWLISLYSCQTRKVVDWRPSFDSSEKKPFGTYICYQEMKTLFPKGDIERISYNLFDYLEENNYNYYNTLTFFDNFIEFDSIGQRQLRDFVDKNNIIFFSFQGSNLFGDSIATYQQDSFYGSRYEAIAKSDSTFTLSLTDLSMPEKTFKLKGNILGNYFTKIPESAIVLGNIDLKGTVYPNFIKVPYRTGWYYLHAEPFVFTNIALLNTNTAQYTESVFGYMPPTNTILWNNYKFANRRFQNRSDGGAFAFLGYTWKQPALKTGILLFLLGGILYVLFNSLRRQQAVPYEAPYKNDVLNYSESLTNTYSKSNNFKYLCSQKMAYFRNMMYENYYFTQIDFNDEFAENLHYKSQVPLNQCITLVNYLNNINQSGYCSREQFVKLSALIDSFYQNSKLYGK